MTTIQRKQHQFSIKITSPKSVVALPYSFQADKVKILSARFVTNSADLEFMLLNIYDWNTNNTYFDGTISKQYTKFLALNPTSNSWHFYSNNVVNSWDHMREVKQNVSQITIEALVDGNYEPTEISSSYPLYLELQFE
jgi:hypothetical protein